MKIQVENCSRCGGTHANLKFKRFKRPMLVANIPVYTHWALCPTNCEPVILSKSSK